MWVPPSRLYAIVDAALCRAHAIAVTAAAEACFRGGARLLQLRAKELGSRALLEAADAVVAAARPFGATVIVNDRPDVARLAGAGGVHVGQDDLPPDAVRRVMEEGVLGLSTHDEAQVAQALRSPLDYIAVGPLYATATKETGYSPRSAALLRTAAAGGTPVVAIGGITLERAPEVLAAGASAVAVISDLLAAGDIEGRVREYIQTLDG